MIEKDLYPELIQTFRTLGCYVPKRMGFIPREAVEEFGGDDTDGTPEASAPDYAYVAPGYPGGVVEVKYQETNFPFAELDRQRGWMDDPRWASLQRWVWLGMGLRRERQTFLIPWDDLIAIEAEFLGHGLKGIPHLQPKNLVHRELGLSAERYFGPYALAVGGQLMSKNGKPKSGFWWKIPDTHIFWKLHESTPISNYLQPALATIGG